MPEVIINGPAGRLECRYMPGMYQIRQQPLFFTQSLTKTAL